MSMLNIEEILKELGPANLQILEQSIAKDAPAVRKTIQNIMDEPIFENNLKNEPLTPKTFQPIAPTRKKKGEKNTRKFEKV